MRLLLIGWMKIYCYDKTFLQQIVLIYLLIISCQSSVKMHNLFWKKFVFKVLKYLHATVYHKYLTLNIVTKTLINLQSKNHVANFLIVAQTLNISYVILKHCNSELKSFYSLIILPLQDLHKIPHISLQKTSFVKLQVLLEDQISCASRTGPSKIVRIEFSSVTVNSKMNYQIL